MHLISFCLSKFVLLILGIVRILFIKRRKKKKNPAITRATELWERSCDCLVIDFSYIVVF